MKRKNEEEFAIQFRAKNPTLTLLETYINSKTPLEWECKVCGYVGHSYPQNLLTGVQCRSCRLQGLSNSMRTKEDEFLEKLHNRRPDIEALEPYKGYREDILFRCKICGFIWNRSPDVIFRSKHCPRCSKSQTDNNALVSSENGHWKLSQEEFISRLKQIDSTILPVGEYVSSSDPIRCKCLTCGKEWNPIASNILAGSGCPVCARINGAEARHNVAVTKNNFAKMHPELAMEWDYEQNGELKPEDFSSGCDTEVWWLCPVGHHYRAKICSRTARRGGTGCSICSFRSHTSFPEQAIYFYLKQSFPDTLNNKKKIKRFSIDIYIPSIKTAIEYDGRAWHGQNAESREREIRKYVLCKDMGITLIRVQEKLDATSVGVSCDIVVESKFAEDRFTGLDACVTNLLELMNVKSDVDTRRDALKIKAQYFTVLQQNSLSDLYPDIAKEWDYEQNGNLLPEMFTPGSSERVSWICPKGHHYPAIISLRVRGSGCSKCFGRNKTTEEFREQLRKINPTIEVLGEYINNRTAIQCRCTICGKNWPPTPNTLLDNHGCPDCADRKRAEYKKEYHRRKKEENKE